MLNDAPPTLLNTIMHNKHLSHLMAKSMNELAHKSPLILSIGYPRRGRCEGRKGEHCFMNRETLIKEPLSFDERHH